MRVRGWRCSLVFEGGCVQASNDKYGMFVLFLKVCVEEREVASLGDLMVCVSVGGLGSGKSEAWYFWSIVGRGSFGREMNLLGWSGVVGFFCEQ